MEAQFNETDALKLIENTLSTVKKRFSENGFIYLLWGWIVLAGNVLSYFWFTQKNGPGIGFTWMILCIAGGITSAVYYARKEKTAKASTHLDSLVSYVWAGIGIGAGIFYTYLIINQSWDLLAPFIMLAAGMATFTTGRMLRFAPLVVGALFFWAAAIAMFFLASPLHFIVGAVAMVPGYLVPGYMLRAQYKKQKADVREA